MIKILGTLLNQVRENKPLVHHITNYVTANDCANVTLGIGASPVMADAIGEVEDIVAIANSLVLNMGTLNENTILSMIAAGKAANVKGIPVVFDPVGAGASKLRNETAMRLISEIKLSVLRGNVSEIKFISGLRAQTKGVDTSENDLANLDNVGEIAKELAKKLGCVVVVSGATDTVSDGNQMVYIANGHAMLGNLTGTGCMCSSLIGSFCGVLPDKLFQASTAAMLCMGIAGEDAFAAVSLASEAGQVKQGGFHMALHDAISCMNASTLERQAKYHEA